ncbi:MAG: hypothetical protein QOE06_2642 [Thermoleophilaceae bacterium]|nr:hypothetical protein [Thermoleophilaceae bacterium]
MKFARLSASLLAFAAALLAAAPASASVTQKQAAARAVHALGSDKGSAAVIVFGLPKAVKAGTKITEAGTANPGAGSTTGLDPKLRGAGVRAVRAPAILTASKRSYLFYEDRGPFQLYQHPGRVALVDAVSGKVTLSRTITWPPLVDGRMPVFLKTSAAYRSGKYQVLYRPWTVPGATPQPRTYNRNVFDQDPFGPGKPLPSRANSKAIADRLAAEHSCVLRVTDTLPTFWNANELNLTRSYVGTLFEQLERDNAGFIDERYGARSGESLAQSVDALTARGCKDVLLYIAGQGYSSGGEPVIQIGTGTLKGGLLTQQNISASDLRKLISGRPGVTFKLKFDAPYAGGMVDKLRDLQNVLLIETAAAAGQQAFAFIPNVQNSSGQTVDASQNPAGLLEFTNCELVGLKAFFDSKDEIDRATQAQNEGVSFLAEMLARSQELCKGTGFADDLGASPQLYAAKRGSGKGTNRPPDAEAQSVSATEDTPKTITLNASDPDGDSLTYTVSANPSHGTLTGSGKNLTYTPAADYSGPDSFQFTVTDGKGGTDTETVTIDVAAADDAPVVTNGSSSPSVTENGAAAAVNTGAGVSDVDDTHLESAKVRVVNFQAGDVLAISGQPAAITGSYDSSTGVLTLTGHATKSDWALALGSVSFRTDNDNPPASKHVEFVVNDGDVNSAPVTKDVAVTPVNDPPAIDLTNIDLVYTENDKTPIDSSVTLADPDSTQLNRAVVSITGNFTSAEDDLAWVDNNTSDSITLASDNNGTGVLTLQGSGTLAEYRAAIQAITYEDTSNDPSTAKRTISAQVRDTANATSNTDTRDIQVNAVDDPPDAQDDSKSLSEDAGATTINVLGNDTDVDAGQKKVIDKTNGSHGTVAITNGGNDLTYTPASNFCGSDSFTYTVNGGDTATVSITVNCVDDAADAIDDTATVSEDSTASTPANTIDVRANDTDADTANAGGTKDKVIDKTNGSHGTVAITNGGNDLTYVPNANYCGSDSFTYKLAGGDTATVNVTVSCVEDAADAVDDTATVAEDSTASTPANTIDVRANDTDADTANGAAKDKVTDKTNGANGTVTITHGGDDLTYVPNANFCGSDSFTYKLAGGDTATVSVTVSCSEDAADAVNDTATVAEDSTASTPANTIDVRANDTDPDATKDKITDKTNGTNGTVTITNGGNDLTYVPNANFCGSDSFTYQLAGGDTATVSVTVTCVEDPADAIDDTATVNEDSTVADAANTIDVRANDTDADTANGAAKDKIVDKTNGTNGTVTITNGGNDLTYVPNANFCGSDSFTYKLAGGDSATVNVSVTCVPDNADAVNDTATVNEDSGANTIDVRANDTDPDATKDKIIAKTDGSHGTVAITNGGDDLTYTPNDNYCNSTDNPAAPDTFTYKLAGGDTATVSVTVTCLNDAPVVDLNGEGTSGINTSATFTQSAIPGPNPTPVAPSTDVSDVDNANLASATITLTNPQDVGEVLAVNTGGTTIVATGNNSTSITLTGPAGGPAAKQEFEDVLRTLTYDDPAAVPNATARTIQVTVNDGLANSVTATATMTVVPFNVPPVVDLNGTATPGLDNSAGFTEGSPAVAIAPSADITDADNATLASVTVKITNLKDGSAESLSANPGATGISVNYVQNSGTLGTLTLSKTGPQAPVSDYTAVLRTVKYNNTSDTPDPTPRSITVVANDGVADSNTATSTVSVTATNDAPVNTVPGAQTFNEDTTKAFSGADKISVNDVDVGGGNLTVTLGVANGTLTMSTTAGLAFGPGDGTADQTMTFTGTQSDVNAALATLSYAPNSNFNGIDSLSVSTNDNGNSGSGGAQSDTDSVQLNVSAINDSPVNTLPSTSTVNEDTDLTLSPSVADPDAASIKVTLTAASGKITLSTTAGLAFTVGNGTANSTMTFTGTVAAVNTAMTNLKYRGNQDFNGTDSLTMTSDDQGSSGGGAAATVDSDVDTITVNPVNDAPVAVDDLYNGADSAIGNTTLAASTNPSGPKKTITGNVLTKDTANGATHDSDVDGPGPLLTSNPGVTVSGTFQPGKTNLGGTVTLNSDGTFTYNPPQSVSCSDHTDYFDYTVSDQDPTPLSDTGRATINVTGCVWYVDSGTSTVGDNGTSVAPYHTIQQAETKSGSGDTVFVFKGNSATTPYLTGSSYTMNSGERLIGEHTGLAVDPDGAGATYGTSNLQPANPGAYPILTDTTADVVDLSDGVEVKGLTLDPAGANGGICGGTACGGQASNGSTLTDINILDTGTIGTGPKLELDGTTGTHAISNLVIDDSSAAGGVTPGGTGVRLNNAGAVTFASSGQISIKTFGAPGLVASGATTNLGASVFDDITVAGSGSGGVSLTNTTGTPTFGDGAGTDLNLTTTSGATPAFGLANAGTVSVPSAAASTATVSATGGPAVDITSSSTGSGINFDSASSTNSANDGINIDGLTGGSFLAFGGTIGGYDGIGFDLNGGGSSVTYDGNFTDAPAVANPAKGLTAIEVTGRTGGPASFAGSMADSNDEGGGIVVSGNSGGQTSFSGATKQMNTGSKDAVSFTTSPSHTLTLSGGGLNVDTTTGNGINATSSGTINVSGAGNTVDKTGSGNRGVNVSDTSIGSSNLLLEHVSTSGAINGIRLNNTGATGHLDVQSTGSGTCDVTVVGPPAAPGCTGGAILNSTDDGVELTSTTGTKLSRVGIKGSVNSGVWGTGVSGLDLQLMHLDSNGNATSTAGVPDSGFAFGELTGTNSISGATVRDSRNSNIDWQPASSTGELDISHTTLNKVGQAGCTNTCTQGADGIFMNATGTSSPTLKVTGTLANPTLISQHPEALRLNSQDSANLKARVDGVTFQDGAFGFEATSNGSSHNTFELDNSTFTRFGYGAGTQSTVSFTAAAGTMNGTISGNAVGDNNVRSGGLNQFGISGEIDDPAIANIDVSGNNVKHTAQEGILISANDFSSLPTHANVDLTVRNNTVGAPDGQAVSPQAGHYGTRIESRQDSDLCLDMAGNNSTGWDNVAGGTIAGTFTGIRVRERDTALFSLERLPASTTNNTTVASFVASQNSPSTANALNTAGFTAVADGTCQNPNLVP